MSRHDCPGAFLAGVCLLAFLVTAAYLTFLVTDLLSKTH